MRAPRRTRFGALGVGALGVGALGALVASSVALGEAQAVVPDQYGFGSRSAAMAGAVTADAKDFSAGYYNPAGIAEAPGVQLSLGYLYNVQNLLVGGQDTGVDDVHGVVIGLVAPGTVLGIPFAFSVGVHLPDDGLSYINARRQGVPRWELYDMRTQLIYLEACLAVRPWPWVEIGGGIGYLTATRGAFGIRGRADIISPYDSQLEHQVDADLTAVRYPQAGIRFLWEGWGALGVTYRGASNLDLDISALLDGIVDFAGIEVPLLYALEARTFAGFTPQQVAVGLSLSRVRDLSLNVDVTWVDWSAYKSPTAEILARLSADPPPGTPVELPDEPLPTEIIAPEFEDRFVPRVGVEYRGAKIGPVEIPLRVGYVFEASPVPDQPGVTNLIDADRHTLTVGLGVDIVEPFGDLIGALGVDAHGLFSFFPERTYLKDNAADFIGDFRASGTIFGGGGTVEVTF